MPLYRSASLILAGAAAVGCSAPVMDDVADGSSAMTEGVVSVERLVAGDGAAQTNVSAKFMRLSSPVDSDVAARMVGAKIEAPSVGSCRRVTESPQVSSSLGTIELIDVGDVTLQAGSARMPLAVRAFPDVGDLVSGMFYTSLDATSDLPAGATYTLEGTGSALVDRFSVDAEAPPPLDDVRVSGAPLTDGVTVAPGAPVVVQWRTTGPVGGDPQTPGPAGATRSGDVVIVDVSAENGTSVRCTFADAGRGDLPSWALPTSAAALTVHRVRERAFVAPGIDVGELRFDLSVMGRVVVSSLRPAQAVTTQPAP